MREDALRDQDRRQEEFRRFAAEVVEPLAGDWDRAQAIPASALAALAQAGYFGAHLPEEFGGKGWDAATFGLLHEAVGRADSALAGYLTVQAMVSAVILKWGDPAQRRRWLPPLAEGRILASFALTEPDGGSDLAALRTEFRRGGPHGGLLVEGDKQWISGGQTADVFLVFGRLEGQPIAGLVRRDSGGMEVEPIRDMMGFRAAGLARLRFRGAPVAAEDVLGRPGFAFSHLAPVGLQWGRLSTAHSALGLLRACFEASTDYAATRRSSGSRVGDLGMIQSLIARMGADLEAARLLCASAAQAEAERRPESFRRAFLAKYFVSRAVTAAAANAVQIHGAAGCQEDAPVARYYRNAKIMEIIEGTTQVHETILGQSFVDEGGAKRRRPAPPVPV